MSSCASDRAVIRQAAQQQGIAAARVTLPAQPAECSQTFAHAPVAVGADVVVVLSKERRIVNRANALILRCAAFDASVAAALR